MAGDDGSVNEKTRQQVADTARGHIYLCYLWYIYFALSAGGSVVRHYIRLQGVVERSRMIQENSPPVGEGSAKLIDRGQGPSSQNHVKMGISKCLLLGHSTVRGFGLLSN